MDINYKLQKTNTKLIITSDENFEVGDVIYDFKDNVFRTCKISHFPDGITIIDKWCKKVIATQDIIDLSDLSEEEQTEISCFDVGVYAIKQSNKFSNVSKNDYVIGCIDGFRKSQELLSDKSFTLEDIIQILLDYTNQLQNMKFKGTAADTINQFVSQSLSKPKSWDIEFVEENGIFKITKIFKK